MFNTTWLCKFHPKTTLTLRYAQHIARRKTPPTVHSNGGPLQDDESEHHFTHLQYHDQWGNVRQEVVPRPPNSPVEGMPFRGGQMQHNPHIEGGVHHNIDPEGHDLHGHEVIDHTLDDSQHGSRFGNDSDTLPGDSSDDESDSSESTEKDNMLDGIVEGSRLKRKQSTAPGVTAGVKDVEILKKELDAEEQTMSEFSLNPQSKSGKENTPNVSQGQRPSLTVDTELAQQQKAFSLGKSLLKKQVTAPVASKASDPTKLKSTTSTQSPLTHSIETFDNGQCPDDESTDDLFEDMIHVVGNNVPNTKGNKTTSSNGSNSSNKGSKDDVGKGFSEQNGKGGLRKRSFSDESLAGLSSQKDRAALASGRKRSDSRDSPTKEGEVTLDIGPPSILRSASEGRPEMENDAQQTEYFS